MLKTVARAVALSAETALHLPAFAADAYASLAFPPEVSAAEPAPSDSAFLERLLNEPGENSSLALEAIDYVRTYTFRSAQLTNIAACAERAGEAVETYLQSDNGSLALVDLAYTLFELRCALTESWRTQSELLNAILKNLTEHCVPVAEAAMAGVAGNLSEKEVCEYFAAVSDSAAERFIENARLLRRLCSISALPNAAETEPAR